VILEFIEQNIHPIIYFISIVYLISFIIQLFYWLFIYPKALVIKKTSETSPLPPVSVIICARNEKENLKNNLSEIVKQDYPDFEVIVVNDASTDDSDSVLANYKLKYPHFNYTNIDENINFYHGKKLALTVGIKAAKNELLVLTDADCFPKSKFWLQTIASTFKPGTDIVLGYGGYELKKGFLNKIIQYDTLMVAIQYLGMAAFGFPYMGVGRNLAYRKSVFIKNKGFASHANILSGDDDLFINEVACKQNTSINFSSDGQILSKPKEKINDWLIQKKRHLTTGKHYKLKDKILLGLEYGSKLFLYLTFILLLILNKYLYIVLSLFILRIIIQLIIQKLYMKKLEIKNILLFSPFFDMLIPLINLYLLFTNYLSQRNTKWK